MSEVESEPSHDARPRRAGRPRRSEQALLEAAAAVFVTSGVDAPVREIAAKAGVGVGTIYRHFPTRPELVVAVYHPAAALHQNSLRKVIAEDFAKLPGFIQSAAQARKRTPTIPARMAGHRRFRLMPADFGRSSVMLPKVGTARGKKKAGCRRHPAFG